MHSTDDHGMNIREAQTGKPIRGDIARLLAARECFRTEAVTYTVNLYELQGGGFFADTVIAKPGAGRELHFEGEPQAVEAVKLRALIDDPEADPYAVLSEGIVVARRAEAGSSENLTERQN